MRLLWVLLFIVVVCFVVSLLWPSLLESGTVPPGQYPINKARPSWSATQHVRPYRPMDPEDDIPFAKDVKFRCGTSKSCPDSLATVKLDL